jgi:hypothetical protein
MTYFLYHDHDRHVSTQIQPSTVTLKSRRKRRVIKELDAFISQWRSWAKEVAQIKDHQYDRMMQSSVYLDGEENIQRHNILQELTLAFLSKNIVGHGFIWSRQAKM